MPPILRYRPEIDGCRAIAILLVVGYHIGLYWLPSGFVGVDVFFVISGYLIASLLVAEQRCVASWGPLRRAAPPPFQLR